MQFRTLLSRYLDKFKIVVMLAKLHLHAWKHARYLDIQQNNVTNITNNDLILFSVMKDEAHRLPFFIDYYRRLGVDHFILVDNASSDHFNDVVSEQKDITTFYTDASYKASKYGMHWLNYLLRKYGSGHWCMTCDPDEFIIFTDMEHRDLIDLTNYLISTSEESFFTCMIDMYGNRPVNQCHYTEGSNPLDTCPYFDKAGYVKTYMSDLSNIWMQGGVRRRLFFRDQPSSSPSINKIPLVRWKTHFAYVESMHMAIPRRLNECVAPNKTTGALLHFKFISQLSSKVKAELKARQHFNYSSEYKQYDKAIRQNSQLFNSTVSEKYEGWRTLAKLGLINKGEW